MRYKSGETLLLQYLGSGPVLRIVDFFLDNPLSEYPREEVAANLQMNGRKFSECFGLLVEMGIVKGKGTSGKARLYRIDRSSPMVKTITEFERKLSMQIADNEMARTSR